MPLAENAVYFFHFVALYLVWPYLPLFLSRYVSEAELGLLLGATRLVGVAACVVGGGRCSVASSSAWPSAALRLPHSSWRKCSERARRALTPSASDVSWGGGAPTQALGSCASDSPRHSDGAFDVMAELAALRAQLQEEVDALTSGGSQWVAVLFRSDSWAALTKTKQLKQLGRIK